MSLQTVAGLNCFAQGRLAQLSKLQAGASGSEGALLVVHPALMQAPQWVEPFT